MPITTNHHTWHPIDKAPKLAGREILGVQLNRWKYLGDPFLTFWSPSLNRFYRNPTHYIELPEIDNDDTNE